MKWPRLLAQTGAGREGDESFHGLTLELEMGRSKGGMRGQICRDSRPVQEAERMRVWCARCGGGTCVASSDTASNVLQRERCSRRHTVASSRSQQRHLEHTRRLLIHAYATGLQHP